jgi:putative salt-induced outer membrane protein YdiY
LFKTARQALIAEIGAGYLAEDRYNEPKNDFTSGRVYSKYTFAVSPTSSFSQDAEYLHNFDNPRDFRTKTETSLTAAINTHFSMKTYFTWKYVGVPPPGFGRNDTTTGVALVATY